MGPLVTRQKSRHTNSRCKHFEQDGHVSLSHKDVKPAWKVQERRLDVRELDVREMNRSSKLASSEDKNIDIDS
jgi:hypothetical protein